MKDENFLSYAKFYDNFYLKRKNYRIESRIIKRVIDSHQKKSSKTLLDIGCGTAEHLKYISSDFACTGMDINKHMISIAKLKVPRCKFIIEDMTNFKVKKKFDVITCLFSAIGYTQTFKKLVIALKNFRNHLEENGLLIVEPWIFKKNYKKNYISFVSLSDEKLKLARMDTSKITNNQWIIYMHYLIGHEGKIEYFEETHKMLALNYQDYANAFRLAGFKNVKYLNKNLWKGSRGLFIATK